MSRALLAAAGCALALGLSACTKEPAAPAAPKPPPPPPEKPCTLETVLEPGIPGSPGHLLPSDINPNGQSELAALMREMQADMKDARAALEKGEVPSKRLLPRYRRIRCSWPTRPADRNPTFDGLAVAYLGLVQAYDLKDPDPRRAYDNVLKGCRTCHEASCPGPIAAIDALSRDIPSGAPDVAVQSCTHGEDAGAATPTPATAKP